MRLSHVSKRLLLPFLAMILVGASWFGGWLPSTPNHSSAVHAAQVTEIALPGTRVFPESITSLPDGTLIIGSLGHGNIFRVAPGSATAEDWIKAGTNGLNSVLGVYADTSNNVLWVCSNKFDNSPRQDPTALKTFDLKTGAPKGSYELPGAKGSLCNDIAVGADRTAYISDTEQAAIFMLKPGASALEVSAKDPLLEGADGLAFGDKTTLYVNSVTKNKLLKLTIGADGKSTKIVELKTPRALVAPDGMRTVGPHRLLMAENSGTMTLVTFQGADHQTVVLKTLKDGMESTQGVTEARGLAWVVEGKLNYMDDPKFKDKDPGVFKLYAVPMPSN
jgi:sugar lactone lactonase YvrE